MIIPKAGHVQLMLYDQMGRHIQQLMDEEKMPGTYTVTVNRNGLSSGIYYYKMNFIRIFTCELTKLCGYLFQYPIADYPLEFYSNLTG